MKYCLKLLPEHKRSSTLQNKCKKQKNEEYATRRATNSVNPVSIKPGTSLFQVKQTSNNKDQGYQKNRQPEPEVNGWFLILVQLNGRSPVDVERWNHRQKAEPHCHQPVVGREPAPPRHGKQESLLFSEVCCCMEMEVMGMLKRELIRRKNECWVSLIGIEWLVGTEALFAINEQSLNSLFFLGVGIWFCRRQLKFLHTKRKQNMNTVGERTLEICFFKSQWRNVLLVNG